MSVILATHIRYKGTIDIDRTYHYFGGFCFGFRFGMRHSNKVTIGNES